MKTCPQCCVAKPLTEFHVRKTRSGQPASRCKTCSRDAQRAWRSKQTDYDKRRYQVVKVETRERHLVRKYGVTLADYDAMLAAQGGKCAVCLTTPDTQRYGVFHVDHCHTSGAVRGLLCRGCNNVLGVVNDDPAALARAIAYLGVTVPQIPELIGHAILKSMWAA
jgi:5-methylcytosine-specific restriction endonuclease McrA